MKKQYLFLILIYSVVVLVGVTLKHLHHFAVNRDALLHAVQGEVRPVDVQRNIPVSVNRNERFAVDCAAVADGGRGGQL